MYVSRRAKLVAFSSCVSPTQDKHDFFQNLPEPLFRAVCESGILEQGGDFSWLNDDRVRKALLFAHEAHGGKTRKHGGEIRLIHEIWSAHQVYQICKNPEIERRLKKEGTDASYVLFGMIVHDCLENSPLSAEAVTCGLSKIWGNAQSFARLRTECLDHMSDEDPHAPTEFRIPKQMAKAFVDGLFTLSTSQQLWRMVDKTHHVFADAQYCIKQAQALRQNGTQEQWEQLRALATQRLRRSKEKSFTIKFPLGWIIEPTYRKAQEILARTAKGYHDPAPTPLLDDIRIAGKLLMGRAGRAHAAAIQVARRQKAPILGGLQGAFASLTL